MAPAVAGQEGDLASGQLAEEEGVARGPVRGVHPDLGHVLQEGVEAGSADHTDLCVSHAVTLTGHAEGPAGRKGGGASQGMGRDQAAEVELLLDDAAGAAAAGFGVEAGVLLDEAPRLSLR
ncbi:hypothetical protein GCM10010286_37440 [Streptomyces toxytricini]|nr:hypothetical protein GCM10010286_37440 [Streptomyces toxytricini]